MRSKLKWLVLNHDPFDRIGRYSAQDLKQARDQAKKWAEAFGLPEAAIDSTFKSTDPRRQ